VIDLNASDSALVALARSIAGDDAAGTSRLLDASPALSRVSFEAGVTRKTAKTYLDEFGRYFFTGDAALHIAAGSYRTDIVQRLIEMGSDVHAKNRRGAAPLHLAAIGLPGSPTWNPQAQQATITCLIAAGAEPNAVDKNGVTPLHRAVRTRCATAVSALLAGGADAKRKNNSGSTPMWLATHNTGSGGTGSAAAKAQQREIVRLLEQQVRTRR